MKAVKPLLVVYVRGNDGKVYPVLGDPDTREVTVGNPVKYFLEGEVIENEHVS